MRKTGQSRGNDTLEEQIAEVTITINYFALLLPDDDSTTLAKNTERGKRGI